MGEVGVQLNPDGTRVQVLVQGSFEFPNTTTAREFAYRILELANEVDDVE